ncbi:uncharacterized protein LOC144179380 [Haemaphysalis longicornis]
MWESYVGHHKCTPRDIAEVKSHFSQPGLFASCHINPTVGPPPRPCKSADPAGPFRSGGGYLLYDEVPLSNADVGASAVPASITVGAPRAGEHIVALQPPEALMMARQPAYHSAKACADVAQHDLKRFTAPPLHGTPHELTELAHKLKPHSSSRGDYDVFKLQNQERIELCYRFPDYGGNVRRGGEDKSRDV